MKLSFEEPEMSIRCDVAFRRSAANTLRRRGRADSAAQRIQKARAEERPMNFDMSEKQKEWLNRVQAFMKTHVRPAVPIYDKQDARARAGR
jgi:hypothetical protein